MHLKYYSDATLTLERIDRVGKPNGLFIAAAPLTVEQLDEVIHILNQTREAWQRGSLDCEISVSGSGSE